MTVQSQTKYLVIQAKNGDRNAFGLLYKEYFTRIYRYCRVNMYSNELAEDTSQEVFFRAWKSLTSFSITNEGTFQAYLFRIARNLIIDHSRKKKEYSLVNANEVEYDDPLEDNLQKDDAIVVIKLALAQLKDDDRHIVILRYFEDLSYLEMSKILTINEGTLRVKMNRILKGLRKLITIHG